jgi:hypothetical protein
MFGGQLFLARIGRKIRVMVVALFPIQLNLIGHGVDL